jgi:tRNA(Ile2) C34 agmatinyltransferase TiaS
MEKKIIRNKAKCKLCGDIIESMTRHDFKFCSCKKMAVDGGKDYIKRLGDPATCEEMSEFA